MALISVGNIALGSAAQEGLSAIASSYAKSAETASVPWSAIEYSGTVITAISGSAIGGGGGVPFDSATCSAIASSYAESAASSKLDATASGNFLTSETVTALGDDGVYITSINGSALSGAGGGGTQVVTSLDTATASFGGATTTVITSINETYISSTFSMASDHAYSADYDTSGRPLTSLVATSDMSAYQPSGAYLTTADSATILSSSVVTATGGSGTYVTSINGSGISGAGGGGTDPATVSAIASAYAESAASGKQDSTGMTAYAYESSNSAKLDATAFSDVSGSFLTSVDLSPYQTTAGMSAYAYESSNSAKLDTTAQVVSSTAGDGTYVTAINGMGLSGAGGGASVVTATAGGSSQVSSINGSAILDLSTYNSLTSLSSVIAENSAKWDLITSVSGLTSITASKYTLSAGNGISLNNDTVHKVTVISVV